MLADRPKIILRKNSLCDFVHFACNGLRIVYESLDVTLT